MVEKLIAFAGFMLRANAEAAFAAVYSFRYWLVFTVEAYIKSYY
jgi:hypothetical protein